MISSIKEKAKKELNGRWKEAVNIMVLYIVVSVLITYVGSINDNYLFVVLGNILVTGLDLGLIYYFFNFLKHKNDMMNLFEKFGVLYKGLILFLLKDAYIIIWDALDKLGTYVYDLNINYLTIMYPIVEALTIILIFIYSLNFALSYFILIDNPNDSISDIINKSIKIMKDRKIFYLKFILSFFGLFLISIITIGIGFLWLIPYSHISHIFLYKYLKDNNDKI